MFLSPKAADGCRGKGGDRIAMAARAREFKPQMLFISAGFDAHREDLLGGMALVEADYAWITRELMALAARHAQKRIVSMLEAVITSRRSAGAPWRM